MQSRASRVVFFVLLLAPFATAGQAQELAGSFDQLRVLVKTGDKVRVTDSRGQDVRGSIADVSSSSLALTVGGTRRTLLEADIAAIHQRRNDSLANGARWGFVVGAGLGVLGGITIASEYDEGGAVFIPILGLVYGAMGAGAGAGIDAMHSSERAIYARRGAASKMSLRPILTADRKGVLASLAFGGS